MRDFIGFLLLISFVLIMPGCMGGSPFGPTFFILTGILSLLGLWIEGVTVEYVEPEASTLTNVGPKGEQQPPPPCPKAVVRGPIGQRSPKPSVGQRLNPAQIEAWALFGDRVLDKNGAVLNGAALEARIYKIREAGRGQGLDEANFVAQIQSAAGWAWALQADDWQEWEDPTFVVEQVAWGLLALLKFGFSIDQVSEVTNLRDPMFVSLLDLARELELQEWGHDVDVDDAGGVDDWDDRDDEGDFNPETHDWLDGPLDPEAVVAEDGAPYLMRAWLGVQVEHPDRGIIYWFWKNGEDRGICASKQMVEMDVPVPLFEVATGLTEEEAQTVLALFFLRTEEVKETGRDEVSLWGLQRIIRTVYRAR